MIRILVTLFAFALTTPLFAQKTLSTKSAKISFESRSPLEDIEAQNNEVESKLSTATGQVQFVLLIKGFKFENQLMQEHFNDDYMESTKFPKADFKGSITNIKAINFSKNGTYPANVKGKLTIHGVTKDVTSTGTITVTKGKVSATSKFNIKLKDYKIGGSMIGKEIAETIVITVNSKYD